MKAECRHGNADDLFVLYINTSTNKNSWHISHNKTMNDWRKAAEKERKAAFINHQHAWKLDF